MGRYGEVGTITLRLFPMTTPFGLCGQLVVYDGRHKQFRTVLVLDREWMEEEGGRKYHRENSLYEMWAPIDRSNVQEWTTS